MSNGQSADTRTVVAEWLVTHGHSDEAAPWLASILDRTWPIIRRALYIDGFMLADSSFFPRGVAKAWWTMEIKHSLIDWDPSRADDLRLSRDRMAELLAEKDEAMQMVEAFAEDIRRGSPSLPPDFTLLVDRAGLFVVYVEAFVKTARVCLWARALAENVERVGTSLSAAVEELNAYQDRIKLMSDAAEYPHQVIELIDYKRIADVVREGREVLAGGMQSVS